MKGKLSYSQDYNMKCCWLLMMPEMDGNIIFELLGSLTFLFGKSTDKEAGMLEINNKNCKL
jgi:hypothetical protein